MDKLGKKKRARHSCWRANRYYGVKRGALWVLILVYIFGGRKESGAKVRKTAKWRQKEDTHRLVVGKEKRTY